MDESMESPVEEVSQLRTDLNKLDNASNGIKQELAKAVIGQQALIEQLLLALLTKGHILLEGVPGVAKTLTAKLFAQTIDSGFSRIQFTPDLMPSDIIGTNVYNMKNGTFEFKKGPVFSNIVLIDEINRSPAKTQAALFEVMQEMQVSVDGETYGFSEPFMVIATQNPIEQEGTYKLPEAQLDRFIFKIKVPYPSFEEEVEILNRYKGDFEQLAMKQVKKVLNGKDIEHLRKTIEQVNIEPALLNFIGKLVADTRQNGDIFLGASPRASLAILKTAKAKAAISGRDFVIPEDIHDVCYPVLNHRLILNAEREMEGVQVEDVITEIIQKTEVPR